MTLNGEIDRSSKVSLLYVLLGASSLLKQHQILSLVIEVSGHSQSLGDLKIIRKVMDDNGYVPVMSGALLFTETLLFLSGPRHHGLKVFCSSPKPNALK